MRNDIVISREARAVGVAGHNVPVSAFHARWATKPHTVVVGTGGNQHTAAKWLSFQQVLQDLPQVGHIDAQLP